MLDPGKHHGHFIAECIIKCIDWRKGHGNPSCHIHSQTENFTSNINPWTDPIVGGGYKWWCFIQLFYMYFFIVSLCPVVSSASSISVNQMQFVLVSSCCLHFSYWLIFLHLFKLTGPQYLFSPGMLSFRFYLASHS